jgi:hypothetical protein
VTLKPSAKLNKFRHSPKLRELSSLMISTIFLDVKFCSPLEALRTVRHHIAEDSTLHSHRSKHLRSNKFNDVILNAALFNYTVSGSSVNERMDVG